MNKRQRKKQFKKIHGYNPPKAKDICTGLESLKWAINTLTTTLTTITKKFVDAVNNMVVNIREMSEEEFQEKLERLDPGQVAIAKRIRYGRGAKG